MPIYEFTCQDKHIVEIYFQRYDLDMIEKFVKEHSCPICGKLLSWKKFSRVSDPQFKGRGFYKTDYKNNK